MHFKAPVSIQWIAHFINAEIIGADLQEATGLNEIHKVRAGDITFVDNAKYYKRSLGSAASIIIINKRMDAPAGKVLLYTELPFAAYNKLSKHFAPFEPALAAIAPSAQIGEGSIVQPGAFIGNDVVIGKNCLIHANAVIYDACTLGDNVVLHSAAVIGADAFYYKGDNKQELQYTKMHSCGSVVIHDNVEIGAGSTIDRGVSGDTIIGAGTKIDNLVHIGHGAVIGRNCLFAAQVGIGGKAIIEDGVTLWGQVGVSKDLTVGAGAVVYAQSGVPSSIAGGEVYFGSPVAKAREKMKELSYIKRIAILWEDYTKGA